MPILLQDLRYSLRMLRKSPTFTAGCVLTLALGIGANTAIFSVVDAILFRPLPVAEPERLVRIFASDEHHEGAWSQSYPVFRDYREGSKSFTGMAAFSDSAMHLGTGAGKAERVRGSIVSGSFFEVLGVNAARGRTLSSSDDAVVGASPVVVLSDGLWRRRFGADPNVVGTQVRLNGHSFTVVGVAPPNFVGCSLDSFPELWVPMSMAAQASPEFSDVDMLEERGFSWLDIVARLEAGVTLERAQAELDAIASRRAAAEPENHQDPWSHLIPASAAAVDLEGDQHVKLVSRLLLGVVGIVLLIACADAAGLLLVRAERRQRETAIRLAIGAPRSRIARQLLMESLLLAGLGAGGGVLLASWGTSLLASLAGKDFPLPLQTVSAMGDVRVLGFTVLVATITGLLFGMAPAVRASTVDPLPALKNEVASNLRRRRLTLRDLFVLVQVILAVTLLVGAGLLLRSLQKANAVELGFKPDGVVLASVDVARQGYSEEKGTELFERLLDAIRARPEVTWAALGRSIPVQDAGMRVSVVLEERTADDSPPNVSFNIVTPGYFETMGMTLAAGRDFTPSDKKGSPPVAIVSEALARRFWPGQDPIGKRLLKVGPMNAGVEVVGVARDAKIRTVREQPTLLLYVPLQQQFVPRMTAVIRTAVPAEIARGLAAEVVEGLDPELPVFGVETLREHVGAALSQERSVAALLATFGALALVLVIAGLYGVISYATDARTREFGIRLALGAQRGNIRGIVLGRGLVLAAAGVGIGIAGAIAGSRVLSSLLFEVGGTDPVTLGSVAAILGVVTLMAGLVPARRACRIDPMDALRHE